MAEFKDDGKKRQIPPEDIKLLKEHLKNFPTIRLPLPSPIFPRYEYYLVSFIVTGGAHPFAVDTVRIHTKENPKYSLFEQAIKESFSIGERSLFALLAVTGMSEDFFDSEDIVTLYIESEKMEMPDEE